MKNNEKYKILFLASTTLFTIFAWSENKELANKIQAKERKALQEWFTLQARAFSIPIHQNAVIKDSIGHEMPLREIVLGGGVLALYIDMKQCDACWKKELDYLQKIQTKMRTTHSTIIILGDMRTNEMKLWKRKHSPNIPVYTLKSNEYPELASIISLVHHFYFSIDYNGNISNVLLGIPETRQWLDKYHSQVWQTIKQKEYIKGVKKEEAKAIKVIPSLIEIGEMSIRQKKEFTFKIKNTSDEPILIKDIHASCECLNIDTSSVWIPPQKEHPFHASLLMTTKGDFFREVSFCTNKESSPYYINMVGVVK